MRGEKEFSWSKMVIINMEGTSQKKGWRGKCIVSFLEYFLLEYNCVTMSVSAEQQSESATYIHMSLPSWTSHAHPSHLLGHHGHWTELPVLFSSPPLAVCFTHGSVYMSVLLSQFISASLPLIRPHVHSLRDVKWRPAGYDILCPFRFTPLTSGTYFTSPEGIQCQSSLQFQYPAQSPACLSDMSLDRSAKLQNKYKLLSPLL